MRLPTSSTCSTSFTPNPGPLGYKIDAPRTANPPPRLNDARHMMTNQQPASLRAPQRIRALKARTFSSLMVLVTLAALVLLAAWPSSAAAAASQASSRPALFRSPASDNSRGADFLQQVLTKPKRAPSTAASDSICRPTGHIEDAACDYETVETINSQFFDRLDALRRTDFFKFYKVNLFKECPFWNENGFCMNRACSVETEDEADIPEEFRVKRLSSVTTAAPGDVAMSGSDSSCSCSSTEFCHLDDDATNDGVYVDLLKNPERFTGYAGASANRVWKSIYEENCFNGVKFIEPARPTSSGGTGFVDKSMLHSSSPAWGAGLGGGGGFGGLVSSLQAPLDSGDSEQCLEKRVFYRIISGLHASISIHICHDFLDTSTGEWAPNLECFITRIAEHPERLQNVYFDYVLLLRALSRLGDSRDNFSLRAGDAIEDGAAVEQLDELIADARACPTTFDEAQMFSGQTRESLELKNEFRHHFRNISTIMDCVGCDKCRLWGKLQVHGIGTALKLLFNSNDDHGAQPVQLQKSELVALVNAAHRIAESLRAVERFRDMYQAQRLAGDAGDAGEVAVNPPANTSHPHRTTQQQEATTGKLAQLAHWVEWIERHVHHTMRACRRELSHCLRALGFAAPSSSSPPPQHADL